MFLTGLIGLMRCESKVIYNNNTMQDFKSLCEASYGEVDVSMKLEKLVVFVRNGDRSPNETVSKQWKKRQCIDCNKNGCKMTRCKNGMLTIEGYHQGQLLARFIKEQYYNRMQTETSLISNLNNNSISTNIKDVSNTKRNNVLKELERVTGHSKMFENNFYPKIQGYYYSTKKSYAFLKSILEILSFSEIKSEHIDTLQCNRSCVNLRNHLFQGKGKIDAFQNKDFDSIMASFCTDVPMDCNKFNCDLERMEEVLLQQTLDSEDNLAKMSENVLAVLVDFSNMATFLLKVLLKEDQVSVVSVGNGEMITLLAGLNTNNHWQVPYGSGIFIELWKNKSQERFYSVLYNGLRMKIGLFKEKFVAEAEFIKFIQMFENEKGKIDNICNMNIKGSDPAHLVKLQEKRLKLEMEDLLQNLRSRRVLVKE